MALFIYNSVDKVPNGIKIVKDNDAYFNAKSKLLDNDLVKLVLKRIDEAEYVTEDVFLGRNVDCGNLNKIHLSTGTKTLVNIINFSDICFDVVECGINVFDLLPEISSKVNGHILWKNCIYPFAENSSCDIVYNGKRFTKVFDFMFEVCEEV